MPFIVTCSLLAVQIASVGLLTWLAAYRAPMASVATRPDLFLVIACLLVLVCVGFFLKIFRKWSTRMLWEWIFVGATLLGGWVWPRLVVPGFMGAFLAGVCLFLPFFWSSSTVLRRFVFLIGAAGAGVLFASSLSAGPLWILWIGLAFHDVVATQSMDKLQAFLSGASVCRSVSTSFDGGGELKIRVWASHLVLPAALVAQATWRRPLEGVFLCFALLIGAWYAIMRSDRSPYVKIVPWAAVWMMGAALLMRATALIL